jgi:hypothetical protein
MKLYEIDANLRKLWAKIEEQEGELTEENIKELESLEIEANEKIKGYGTIIREINSDADEVDAEIKRLEKIKKRLLSKADWLTNSLSQFMIANSLNEYKSIEVNIGFRASKKLVIDDNVKLAKKWLRLKEEPDKQAIKDFIEQGGKVKGCKIVENKNIQIK